MERFPSCAAEKKGISPGGSEISSRELRRVAIWALLAASSQNDAKMPQDFDGFQDLQVIFSFLGLRIEGFGGSGARNWRIPGGGGGHEHPQGWEQGEHHSTDPRTAENALFTAISGLGLWRHDRAKLR